MGKVELDRRVMLAAALAAAAPSPAFGQAQARPTARTQHGRVRGATVNGVHVFKGVRYGADTAPRRFQAPVAPRRWSGVVDALAYGAASPQRSNEANQSEDCLFLNVWTPAMRDNAKRAVMFYIHGGAYSNGSGSNELYDGTNLCKYGDVVVVTVNHRLNAFGYLSLHRFGDEFRDSGNAGQLDLILALKWVQENIAEFGGDPSRVFVFGQSGGGAKIATMMAMPAARGLFQTAATMSGQQVTATGPLNGVRRTEALMARINVTKTQVQDLRTLPMARIIEGLAAEDPILGGGVYMGPVLDFVHLTRHPFYPDAAPQGLSIPMILGNTKDETRGFTGSDREVFNLTWEQVAPRLISQMRIDTDPDYVVREYRRQFPQWTPSEVYFAASTAARSWRGQVIEAEERAKAGAPGYVYQVNHHSPREGGIFRAPHTMDIGLSFRNLTPGSMTGDGPDAVAASNALSSAFVSMAKTGNPNNRDIPHWSPYTLPTRDTMIIDGNPRMENNPRGWEREFFAKIPYVQPGT